MTEFTHTCSRQALGNGAMATSKNVLDNLKNLRLVMSVALEHVRENHNQFMHDATRREVEEFEMSVGQIRWLAEQLDLELVTLECELAKRRPT